MYLAAALRAGDLAQAQSTLLLLSKTLGNVSPMFFSAYFFGDREIMTRGYLLATAMLSMTVVVYTLLLPSTAMTATTVSTERDSSSATTCDPTTERQSVSMRAPSS